MARGNALVRQHPRAAVRAGPGRYTGPDGRSTRQPRRPSRPGGRRGAGCTDSAALIRGKWTGAKPREAAQAADVRRATPTTLAGATGTLKPRTRAHYRALLDRQSCPTFGDVPLQAITPDDVRAGTPARARAPRRCGRTPTGCCAPSWPPPCSDRLITANPCHIRGAGNVKRVHKIKPATLAELEAIVAAMPERLPADGAAGRVVRAAVRRADRAAPQRHRPQRRRDPRPPRRRPRRRASAIVGTPKSDAGIRDVAIPPHLCRCQGAPAEHTPSGRDGLLFPAADGGAPGARRRSTAALRYTRPRVTGGAGRARSRCHDLRHTGAVLAASTGATLAELMGRLGHSTPAAALRYQHAAQDRDQEIAAALSALATGASS